MHEYSRYSAAFANWTTKSSYAALGFIELKVLHFDVSLKNSDYVQFAAEKKILNLCFMSYENIE